MDFDMWIGQCDLSNYIDKKDSINEHLLAYINGIDLDKIDYDYTEDAQMGMWFIDPKNEYTKHIFYTERKILLREFKIQRLVKNGNGI